ncbi:MAG: hypothetical protein WBC60_04135 [Cognaticolwellia sp.]
MMDFEYRRIACGKYSPNFPKISKTKKIVRYENYKKYKSNYIPIPISTDGKSVFTGDKTYKLEEFFYLHLSSKNNRYIVLTDMEYRLLVKIAIRYKAKISVLESNFPIFSDIKFNSNLKSNHKKLLSCLSYLKNLGITKHSISKNFSSELLTKLQRRIRNKTSLDICFHYAYYPPYQEVFKFTESRKDRSIFALDYNSMYASCLHGDFVKPNSLTFETINNVYKSEPLKNGIYHVLLSEPSTEFIKKYHPFKYTSLLKPLAFSLDEKDEVEILLHRNEVEYFSKHFSKIWIVSCCISSSNVGHPLYQHSLNLYRKRAKAKLKGKKELEKLYKQQLAMLHSMTNPSNNKMVDFNSLKELLSYVDNKFGIQIDLNNKDELEALQYSKYFSILRSGDCYRLKFIDIDNNSCIYSFSSQILANARLKMCKLLEQLHSIPELDICYTNTDSVHVSIPISSENKLFQLLDSELNSDLGGLKIQAFADKGYWFDVGRYFLFRDDKVVQYKNIFLNHKGNSNPFLLNRFYIGHFKSNNFEHAVELHNGLTSVLTYSKKLEKSEFCESINFSRYRFEQISSFKKMNNTIEKEKLSSGTFKQESYLMLKKFNTDDAFCYTLNK